MRLARHTGLVLLLLMALSQLAANQTAAAAPRKSANTELSNQTIYRVTCLDPSNDFKPNNRHHEQSSTLGPAGVAATPTAPAIDLPAGSVAGDMVVSTPPSLNASETESSSSWSDCEDCNPIQHPILDLMLVTVWMVFIAVVVERVLSSLSNRVGWKKLEHAVRDYLADKDMDKLAGCCRHYNRTAAAPVIEALAAEANVGHPNTLIKLERLKHAWRLAARTELKKWKSALNCLDGSGCVSLIVLATWAVSELARSLNDLSKGGGAGGVLLFRFREDFGLLWCGLLLLVFHLALKRMILSRISKLELRVNQLSIDFIFGLLSRPNRRSSPKYRPGMWMLAGTRSATAERQPFQAQRYLAVSHTAGGSQAG